MTIQKRLSHSLGFLPMLLTVSWLLVQLASAEKLRVLLMCPANKLMNTHFLWHEQLATVLAASEHVEKVILLGLAESMKKEEETTDKKGDKLELWKRNRCGYEIPDCGKTVRAHFGADPIKNAWRFREDGMPPENEGAKRHYLDFLIYNGKLADELRDKKFNFGCIESIGLDGLQLGILHMLSIENTCVTTSVAPTVPHWEFMGFESIVKNIPGLNLAQIGDHKMIENQDKHRLEEITANNQMWLERKGKVGEKTLAVWKKELEENALAQKELEGNLLAESLPTMEKLFKNARYFFVNYQQMLDYKLVEDEIGKMAGKEVPKLRFIGGIGLIGEEKKEIEEEEKKNVKKNGSKNSKKNAKKNVTENVKKVLDEEQQKELARMGQLQWATDKLIRFFSHIPIVLVSFGSVVDVGKYTDEHLIAAKKELGEAEKDLEEKAKKEKEEKAKKEKEEKAKKDLEGQADKDMEGKANNVKEEKSEKDLAEDLVETKKGKVQLIEDSLAKEKTLMTVFNAFPARGPKKGKKGRVHPHPKPGSAVFIWKYGEKLENKEKESLSKRLGWGMWEKTYLKQENVYMNDWLPQKSILAKGPNAVPVFISHCGLNSVMEAVNMGIPLICIPFFGDQYNNSEALASRGVAIVIDLQSYEKEGIEEQSVPKEDGIEAPKDEKDGNEQHSVPKEEDGAEQSNDKLKEKEELKKAKRKELDGKLMKDLTETLKVMLTPGNVYATKMKELSEAFNGLNPAQTIHTELQALHKELNEKKGGKSSRNLDSSHHPHEQPVRGS